MVTRSIVLVSIGGTLALAGNAAAVAPLTLHPGQEVGLVRTRLYCGVAAKSTGVLLTCVVARKGTQTPEGYTVGINDRLAGVTHFVGTTAPAVFLRAQPTLHLPPASAAGKGKGMISMHLGDIALIAGSHVLLIAGRNSRQEAAFAATIVDADNNLPLTVARAARRSSA